MNPYGEPATTSPRAPRGAWAFGRVLGADVHVHWSMVLVPFTLVTLIASSVDGQGAGDALLWTALWTLVATAVVWSHCYAHLWASGEVAAGKGVVFLTPFAPLAHEVRPSASPRIELRSALAGPLVHAVWVGLGYLCWTAFEPDALAATMLHRFVLVNVALWAANLLPFLPMDGGRVLRAALTPSIGEARAEAWTASAGYGGAVTLGLVGLTLLMFPDETLAPWAVFIVGLGVLTLTASQRALFTAQFRAHSERLAARAAEEAERVPDYLDEDELVRTVETSDAADGDEGAGEHAVESAEERRTRLQERIDALLDRINEVGGMDGLSADERRELAETSELLRRETADG